MPVPLTEATAAEMAGRMIFFDHRHDCPGAEMVEEPRPNHPETIRVTCRGCGLFLNLYPRKPKVAQPPRVPLASRWRCRTHTDEPVTWRGNGCRSCAAEGVRP